MKKTIKTAHQLAGATRAIEEFEASDKDGFSKKEIKRKRFHLETEEFTLTEKFSMLYHSLSKEQQDQLYKELGDDGFVCDGI